MSPASTAQTVLLKTTSVKRTWKSCARRKKKRWRESYVDVETRGLQKKNAYLVRDDFQGRCDIEVDGEPFCLDHGQRDIAEDAEVEVVALGDVI